MRQSQFQFVSSGQIIHRRRQELTLQRERIWWGPIWRGLAVEPNGKHYRAMRMSLWLYVYLVIHANRRNGTLIRLLPTIAKDMGVKPRTIRQWLSILKTHGYISTELTGRALKLTITKWKPLRGNAPSEGSKPKQSNGGSGSAVM